MSARPEERRAREGFPLDKALNELPMLPGVVARLMLLDTRSDCFFEELLELLESDPPFALRCLRLANSAASGPENPVTTLQAAVSRLGSRNLVRWLTTMGVTQVFVPATAGQQLLWHHSIQTALGARVLVRTGTVEPTELAYLAGLLHDIGRFLTFRDAPEQLEEVDESGWSSPESLIEVERRLLGYDHAELGGRACELWGLPPVLASVVRNHHRDLADLDDLEPEVRRLVAVVRMADEASILLKHHGRRLLTASPIVRHTLLARCWPHGADSRLDVAGLEAELGEVARESDRMMDALGLPVREAA